MAGSEDVGGMVYLVIPSPNQTQTPLDHKHYPKWFCHLGGVWGTFNIMVGGFNHVEKYEFVNGRMTIYEMENKSHV